MKFLAAPDHIYQCTQVVSRPIGEVFAFFSSEENLEQLTPPWLNFRVLGKSTAAITEGTVIDYQLRLSGLPLRWRSQIEVWEPGRRFVDVQLKGPYQKWHHTHLFKPVEGGTEIEDKVVYQLPFGRLGNLAASWKVRRQVEQIFAFRRQAIAQRFS